MSSLTLMIRMTLKTVMTLMTDGFDVFKDSDDFEDSDDFFTTPLLYIYFKAKQKLGLQHSKQ